MSAPRYPHAAETKQFREQLIEAEADHTAAMIRFADQHQARMKRQRLTALVMEILAFVTGSLMGYALFKLGG